MEEDHEQVMSQNQGKNLTRKRGRGSCAQLLGVCAHEAEGCLCRPPELFHRMVGQKPTEDRTEGAQEAPALDSGRN